MAARSTQRRFTVVSLCGTTISSPTTTITAWKISGSTRRTLAWGSPASQTRPVGLVSWRKGGVGGAAIPLTLPELIAAMILPRRSLPQGTYCSRIWANDWIRTFADPLKALNVTGLVLTRGLWLGAQRHGTVLWSSDIFSTFEELQRQVGRNRTGWRLVWGAGRRRAGGGPAHGAQPVASKDALVGWSMRATHQHRPYSDPLYSLLCHSRCLRAWLQVSQECPGGPPTSVALDARPRHKTTLNRTCRWVVPGVYYPARVRVRGRFEIKGQGQGPNRQIEGQGLN